LTQVSHKGVEIVKADACSMLTSLYATTTADATIMVYHHLIAAGVVGEFDWTDGNATVAIDTIVRD
jgi:hypothetical protein